MAKFRGFVSTRTGTFEIHKDGCADTKKLKLGEYTDPRGWVVEAESGEAALEAELQSAFSGSPGQADEDAEHPAKDGYPSGSYGAADFASGARVMPCCKGAR